MRTPQASTATPDPSKGDLTGAAGRRIMQAAAILLTGLLTINCACSQTQPQGPEAGSPEAPIEPPARESAGDSGAADAAPVPDKAPAELPKGLDTGDLDADERAVLSEILKEQFDPCGKPRSFFDALAAEDSCEMAPRLVKLVVARLADGWSKKQTVALMMQELTKSSKKFDFDLTGAPCVGEVREGQRVIVEYLDFQCPFCAQAFKPAKELAKKHGALICAKQFPLDFHPLAKPAAIAALAAHKQGKYWEYSVQVFEQQDSLSEAALVAIAKKLGLDMGRFETDRKSEAIAAAVKRDFDEATLAGVEGTPTFFVDGIAVDYESLGEVLGSNGGGH